MISRRFRPSRLPDASGLWHHGDASRRTTFAGQRMDRDPGLDSNAVGPGIYWTRDPGEARGYAWPSGWIYTARMRSGARVLAEDMPADARRIARFIDLAPADARETGFSNWDEDPREAKRKAVASYAASCEGLHDALVGIYHDFYGRDAEAFAEAMVKLGWDALLHRLPAVDHLVVWNPVVIEIVSEEKYVGEAG